MSHAYTPSAAVLVSVLPVFERQHRGLAHVHILFNIQALVWRQFATFARVAVRAFDRMIACSFSHMVQVHSFMTEIFIGLLSRIM